MTLASNTRPGPSPGQRPAFPGWALRFTRGRALSCRSGGQQAAEFSCRASPRPSRTGEGAMGLAIVRPLSLGRGPGRGVGKPVEKA